MLSRSGTDDARSHSQWLLATPQAAVRRGEIRRVGCGVDGSEESAHALQTAARVASGLNAELEVIRALAAPSAVINRALSEELAAAALAQLHQALASLPETLFAEALVVQDRDAVRAITARSAELDLLVLGTKAGSHERSAVLGRVSGRLVRAARCPVLVVPPGVEAPVEQLIDARL
jgi:nucleotide-binding universal stress UspA family protein